MSPLKLDEALERATRSALKSTMYEMDGPLQYRYLLFPGVVLSLLSSSAHLYPPVVKHENSRFSSTT